MKKNISKYGFITHMYSPEQNYATLYGCRVSGYVPSGHMLYEDHVRALRAWLRKKHAPRSIVTIKRVGATASLGTDSYRISTKMEERKFFLQLLRGRCRGAGWFLNENGEWAKGEYDYSFIRAKREM